MRTEITCFGGVGEIGGNKILLRDGDTSVFLDFGTGFAEGASFFDAGIEPRRVNGAGDLFEFGLLPEVPGLYSEAALQNTALKYVKPEVDAVILSHYHSDHFGRMTYVDEGVPVYCGETTALIHEAAKKSTGSPLDGHELRTFRTGKRFRVGSMEVIPVHVDHSIPGAYGFIVHTSKGAVVYSGDFRFHGPAGSMTDDLIEAGRDSKPALLITEGTRVSPEDNKSSFSEKSVAAETVRAIKGNRKLVFSSFRGNDVDRVNTFFEAAEKSGRRLVVSVKTAVLLQELSRDEGIKVPSIGRDVLVYMKRKRSGRMDDRDYFKWERPFLDDSMSAQEIRKNQRSVFLHLDIWNFPEVIDIKPEMGGAYIHSSSEAFNEEGEREEGVVKNWIDHMGFSYHQIHASGHAPMAGVRKLVVGIGAKRVVPVHTEFPELFRGFQPGVVPPVKGEPLSL